MSRIRSSPPGDTTLILMVPKELELRGEKEVLDSTYGSPTSEGLDQGARWNQTPEMA